MVTLLAISAFISWCLIALAISKANDRNHAAIVEAFHLAEIEEKNAMGLYEYMVGWEDEFYANLRESMDRAQDPVRRQNIIDYEKRRQRGLERLNAKKTTKKS